MAAQKFQYCTTVKNFQTGVCRISVALYVFYGTYIYYIMFEQDGTPLFNFKCRLCVCIVRRHGYIKKQSSLPGCNKRNRSL